VAKIIKATVPTVTKQQSSILSDSELLLSPISLHAELPEGSKSVDLVSSMPGKAMKMWEADREEVGWASPPLLRRIRSTCETVNEEASATTTDLPES
jgi:hypothetical protein